MMYESGSRSERWGGGFVAHRSRRLMASVGGRPGWNSGGLLHSLCDSHILCVCVCLSVCHGVCCFFLSSTRRLKQYTEVGKLVTAVGYWWQGPKSVGWMTGGAGEGSRRLQEKQVNRLLSCASPLCLSISPAESMQLSE